MKIRLISYRGTGLYLNIENRYACDRPVVSIGCDCHPAYVLQSLNIRTHSFPFDWMNTEPCLGLRFVNANVKNKFKFFLSDLVNNERGYVVSTHFEQAEFFHYPELIQSQGMKNTLSRRASRFMEYVSSRECYLLFNITSESLVDYSSVSKFVDSVNEFHEIFGGNNTLLIYIRFDDDLSENYSNCHALENMLKKIPNTRVVNYVRKKSDFGIWGDKKQYAKLLESLGVKLTLCFPRVYLSKKSRKRK